MAQLLLCRGALLVSLAVATVLFPTDLRVDFIPSTHAVIVSSAPEFSWISSDSTGGMRGLAQVSFQLQVSSNPAFSGSIFDSGLIYENITKVAIPVVATQPPDSILYWRVRVGGSDDSATSEWVSSSFLRGLESADFSAQWIAPISIVSNTQPVRLRTLISAIPADVLRATVYIASPCYWHLFSGGAQLDAGTEMGSYTVFESRILYSAIDVTSLVQASGGAVALGVRLAPGPYGWSKFGFPYDGAPLLLELRVSTANGTMIFATGTPSMHVTAHADPITSYSWYDGEAVDARLEAPLVGWDTPAFNETKSGGWEDTGAFHGVGSAAVLTPQDFAKVTRVMSLSPVALSIPAPGVFTFSFGQVCCVYAWERVERFTAHCPTLRKLRVIVIFHLDS